MFDADSDIVLLNDPGPFGVAVGRRGLKTRGKQRTTIEIRSEILLHQFDEHMLGAGPAQAIRDAISNAIKGITEFAAPATIRRRQVAAKAFTAGARWAMKRYSGGRTGATPPNQSPRLFNDSSRLANGVFVRQNPEDATFTVNVPANRLDPSEFEGSTFEAMLNKLRSLVPILQDSRQLLADDKVRAAINQSIRDLITKAQDSNVEKLKLLAAARKRAVMQIIRLFV